MGNLLVAGCSVSDYTKVDKVWGEYLAEELNLNYIHEGAGCGSNWRMWRVIVDAVKSKRITPEDRIFVQYTETTRREFWSPYSNKRQPLWNSNDKSFINDTYKVKNPQDGTTKVDGVLIRYKIDSYLHHHAPADIALLKSYNKHVNPPFEKELFLQQHSMFQCFMKQNGFNNVYFINVGGYGFELLDEWDDYRPITEPFYKDNFKHVKNAFDPPWHLPLDLGHLSEEGHANLAKELVRHFQFRINT